MAQVTSVTEKKSRIARGKVWNFQCGIVVMPLSVPKVLAAVFMLTRQEFDVPVDFRCFFFLFAFFLVGLLWK